MWLRSSFLVAFCCTLLHTSVCQPDNPRTRENLPDVIKSILDFRCTRESCDIPGLFEDMRDQWKTKPNDSTNIKRDSYQKFCEEFRFTLEEIESRHPEFKSEKFELLAKFRRYSAEFASVFKESYPGAPVLKFLNLLVTVIEKLKSDYAGGHAEENLHIREASTDAKKHTKVKAQLYEPVDYTEEIVAEEQETVAEEEETVGLSPGFVGSVRGIPGEHYPNYSEVPITSFTCDDKKYIPGFYADLETGCQVFHVCYKHRRESFLCPVGTTFNQPILACDYWYSSNCSLSPLYYDANAPAEEISKPTSEVEATIGALITTIIEGDKPLVPKVDVKTKESELKSELASIIKFLPVKAQVVTFPDVPEPAVKMAHPPVKDVEETASKIFDSLLSTTTQMMGKTRDVIKAIPDPSDKVTIYEDISDIPVVKVMAKIIKDAKPIARATKIKATAGVTKAKVATVPFVAKVAAAGAAKAKVAAVPVAAKLAAAGAAKAKVFPAVKVAAVGLPKFKLAKASVPVVKGKMLALPLAKAKFAAAVPIKAKASAKFLPGVKFAGAAKSKLALAPLKAKVAGIPLKFKIAKAAAISPLTKKALALGYMKLLKAKKLAIMG